MQYVGIGQDSHRFEPDNSDKPLVLGGIVIPGCPGLMGNSDADVVLHAVVNAVSGVSAVNILGDVSDLMCLKQGIRNSAAYLAEALKYLQAMRPVHLSVSLGCARPRLSEHIRDMRGSLAELLGLSPGHVGITATSGEGLTAFGRGEGIFCTAVLTVHEDDERIQT
jgi:2-C-methyl-D-erythritol 2,4-cyclodiphosphate synthase